MSINGEKRLLYRYLTATVSALLVLVGTVWAITWSSTEKKTTENKVCIEAVRKVNARQDLQINTLENDYEHIIKKLDEIYKEVKK